MKETKCKITFLVKFLQVHRTVFKFKLEFRVKIKVEEKLSDKHFQEFICIVNTTTIETNLLNDRCLRTSFSTSISIIFLSFVNKELPNLFHVIDFFLYPLKENGKQHDMKWVNSQNEFLAAITSQNKCQILMSKHRKYTDSNSSLL